MNQETPKNLITVKELSEYLKIPVGSIYNMVYTHKIPVIRVGRRLRFFPDAITEWLKKKEVKPDEN